MTELENQLKATEATPDTDACLEWHTKIMTQLFAIYFRILKKGEIGQFDRNFYDDLGFQWTLLNL